MSFLAGICLTQALLAQTKPDPCTKDENSHPPYGEPLFPLCSQYQNLHCNITIGNGTFITHSSQLGPTYTGNVCITGDFTIDAQFTFKDCIVKILPGVKIVVETPTSFAKYQFTIDNSKLFACSGLWEGIHLKDFASISTLNNTRIEGANNAILVDNRQMTRLSIIKTGFTQNRVGIKLDNTSGAANPPVFIKFSDNYFNGNAPLSGTSTELPEAGIKLVNAPFSVNPAEVNEFNGMRFGILAEGTTSSISASKLNFLGQFHDGIRMGVGMLNIKNCLFYDCNENGVNITFAQQVDIRDCEVIMTSDMPANANHCTGVRITWFLLNSKVYIGGYSLIAGFGSPDNKARGIHLEGGLVGSGTDININGGNFLVYADNSQGIYIEGPFPQASFTQIFNNDFGCSTDSGGETTGILTEGILNNVNLYGNRFTENTLTGGDIKAITLKSSNGIGNRVETNSCTTQATGRFITVDNFQNGTICANYIQNSSALRGFDFYGSNPGTDYTGNIMNMTYLGLKVNNSLLSPQGHKGNKWIPPTNIFGLPSFGLSALCQNCSQSTLQFSKITVHTPQSVWNNNTNQWDYYSEYYPAIINPGGNQFFDTDTNGTPANGCAIQLTGPGTDELDRAIADGLYVAPTENPAMGWLAKRHLYRKLAENPSYVSEHPSYQSFLSGQLNTSVGRLYEVSNKIEEAITAQQWLDIQSKDIMDDIALHQADISAIDGQIAAAINNTAWQSLVAEKSDKEGQVQALQTAHSNIYSTYLQQAQGLLQDAYAINETVPAAQPYEVYEKAVNKIYLLSRISQNGVLTESQIEELKIIGQTCTEQGGLAVYAALNLLPECEKEGLEICFPEDTPDEYFTGAGPELRSNEVGHESVQQGSKDALIYPNPSASSFFVRLPNGSTGTITIRDMTGRAILAHEIVGTIGGQEIVHGLAPGVYLANMKVEGGYSATEKIIVLSK